MNQPWKAYQAVYVHIPFCVQKCLYCDFASYANCSEKIKTQYVNALCQEIARPLSLPIAPCATIYFGGGTPSTLSLAQLETIVKALKKQGLWQQPQEATIEVNPGTVDKAKLLGLKELGFTRISMGVQSLNDAELHAIGRIHTAKEALEALQLAKEAGFTHLNADLIYGLPQQTLSSLEQTLTQLTAMPIDHLSVYGLIVEENTPLESLLDKGQLTLPDEETAADMYDFVQSFLRRQGFTRYEISNYYRTEGRGYSRHNDVYWHYYPYAAFGASAASFDGSQRLTRPAAIADYINWVKTSAIKTNSPAKAREQDDICIIENLSQQELLSEFMLMGLRRTEGANLLEVQERYGINVLEKYNQQLTPFFIQKLLEYTNGHLRLTEAGMAVGNQIFEVFV